MKHKRFTNVAVLKGGVSSEREVSLKSGAAVAKGLREGGYEVFEIDVESKEFELPAETEAVFIALHGLYGEDGEVQARLEQDGLFYTGSGIVSSRIAFDKVLTRERLLENGIPMPKGEVIALPFERTIPLPCVVKPPRSGSSVGCHLVFEEDQWEAAFDDASWHSDYVLVEEYIPGRELTVGIVDGQVLPIVEIRPNTKWYDYESKYITGDTSYVCPAELDPVVAEQVREIAMKSFECLGAEVFGRVDFRLSPENKPYVLELNSIPGFTETSLLPKAAKAAGIGFSELCCRIMELAHL